MNKKSPKAQFAYSKDFYERDEAYLKRIEEKTSGRYWFKDYYNAVLAFSKRNNKILECGCGTGIATSFLHRFRPKIIGIDFSERFIKKAKTRGNYFFSTDITKLPFGNSEFDVVCSADTIEHVPNLDKALNEMDRVLKKNGFLIIQAPNLSTNLFSFNYHKSTANIIKKIVNLLEDFKNLKLRTIEEFALDVIDADKDAFNLVSPIWLKTTLEKNGYLVKHFTTFSLFFKPNHAMKAIILILKKFPLTKYLGGRILLVAQKK